jgi:hypothetical protein
MNSYRGYRLPDGLKHLYGHLGSSICDTRRDTANLARELGSVDLKPPAKVCPNDLDELSLGAWPAKPAMLNARASRLRASEFKRTFYEGLVQHADR